MQDLRTLAIFVKVAERLSFVRAAADLGITQSGVSNAISRLEDQIGTPLLARTTRKVSLTEHGAAYFERCRQALAELEEAELVLKNAQLKPSGNLRIDMPVSFGRIKVVPLLGAFQARYPDIALRVTFNDRYVDHIEESIDVSIRFGVLQDSSLIARRLGGAQLSVVGAPRYFAKFGTPKRPEDLAAHNCLAFTFRETRLAREWRFARSGAQGGGETVLMPKGNMSLSDGASVCDAARAGYGLAQLQDFFIDALTARGQLVSVLDKFKPAAQPIWLVYPQTRHLSPKVRVFVDFMAENSKAGASAPRRSAPSRSPARR
ncbi:MAG TPA: LysR family transcriptional regulator [Xanthobacteraceae bacterium]|nr:LysR family transcriptional regulator [Xanthobacteraceae bacterium]